MTLKKLSIDLKSRVGEFLDCLDRLHWDQQRHKLLQKIKVSTFLLSVLISLRKWETCSKCAKMKYASSKRKSTSGSRLARTQESPAEDSPLKR